MKTIILLAMAMMTACGYEPPSTTQSTGTATSAATQAAPQPQVVINNTQNNNQAGQQATATAAAAASPEAPAADNHAGLIAMGDPQSNVQAVLGEPTSVEQCGSSQNGWWYQYEYCIGFDSNNNVDYQYDVPASKLYLPSW